MSKTIQKTFAGLVVSLVAIGMVAAPATAALDQSVVALLLGLGVPQSLIDQINSSSTTTSTQSSGYVYSGVLKSGSTGSSVVSLQNALNFCWNAGLVADGSFGPATKTAVMNGQTKSGITADGVVGPKTAPFIEACSVNVVSTETTTTTTTTSTSLTGGAGAIDAANFVSGLNNEEIGESEEDVEVSGIKVEASEGSDIMITAVKLDFDQGTAPSDWDKYADEVSIWFEGKEYARVDADSFNDDNNFDRTLSLSEGAIIKADDEGELVVAVSGINNLDSTDSGKTWTVIFENIRFKDAQGAIVTESSQGDIGTETRTFSFETFATSANVELKIATGDDDSINDSHVVDIDDVNDTDDVELFQFTMEAEGNSDIDIDDMAINFVSVGTNVDDIVNTVYLYVDGENIASENVPSSATTTTRVLFDNIDFVIPAGDTVDVVIKGDVNDIQAGTFDEGDTLTVSFGETETDLANFDGEDEEGEDLVDADKTGSASGGSLAFYSKGIMVNLESVSTDLSSGSGSLDDAGTMTIKYTVTAFDGDMYVGDTATATASSSVSEATLPSNQVVYLVDKAGTATVAALSGVVSFVSNGTKVTDSGVTNGVKVAEGQTATFTLKVTRTNTSSIPTGAGQYRMSALGITWATTDAATQNVYDFNLDEFKTDYLNIN